MKPFLHSRGSVKRWGGKPEDYDAIHDFIDGSKAAMPDLRHRAALHHAFGCFIVERVFGRTIVNSDGRELSTRDVAEQHIIEDLGFLPSLEDFLDELPLSTWHGGIHRLPKDKRVPTPEQTREQRRSRVINAVYHGVVRGALTSIEDVDPNNAEQFDQNIDAIIAAVLGTDEHKEET